MPQRFHDMTTQDVFFENSLGAFAIDTGIPDVFRIDDDHWPVPALVHAPGVVDADDALEAVLRRPFLEHFVHVLRPLSRAGLARGAHKNVVAVLAQEEAGDGRWETGD